MSPRRAKQRCAPYAPDGDWARLFATAPGFMGVELLGEEARYATIDRWVSQGAFDAFKAEQGKAGQSRATPTPRSTQSSRP